MTDDGSQLDMLNAAETIGAREIAPETYADFDGSRRGKQADYTGLSRVP